MLLSAFPIPPRLCAPSLPAGCRQLCEHQQQLGSGSASGAPLSQAHSSTTTHQSTPAAYRAHQHHTNSLPLPVKYHMLPPRCHSSFFPHGRDGITPIKAVQIVLLPDAKTNLRHFLVESTLMKWHTNYFYMALLVKFMLSLGYLKGEHFINIC